MKPKKPAFAHSSTGYGRNKHTGGHTGTKAASKKQAADAASKPEPSKVCAGEHDKDLNSGFGDYLRSPEGFEMMKLFVFANTIMLILTMAWPHIQEQFYMVNQWWQDFHYN